MSIVQEALKKAQVIRQPVTAEQRKGKNNFGPAVLLVVFIVLLGVTIKEVGLSPSWKKAGSNPEGSIYNPLSAVDAKTGPLRAEPYSAPVDPNLAAGNISGFALNGIMELVDGPRAIINNVIVASGDVIGGAKVMKIDKNRVVLQKEDSEFTLVMK